MSTRCNIHFTHGGEVVANIYRHSDGYPDGVHGVPASLERFFEAVESQTHDTRFGDPCYLSAKFIVWQAGEFARDGEKPLDFLSLGISPQDHGDIEYVYTVDCGKRDANGRPTVSWDRV